MTLTMSLPTHIPVLPNEVIEALQVRPGKSFVDCTLGLGGHSLSILDNSMPGGRLLGIDADPIAIKMATLKLEPYQDAVTLINDNFNNLESICRQNGFFPVDGILFDLGIVLRST